MPVRQAEGLVPPVLEVRQAAADWQSVWWRKHHTLTHEALLALPTSTGTFAAGGTLPGLASGRSAGTRCRRLLLLLLLLRLLRLLLRLLLLLLLLLR